MKDKITVSCRVCKFYWWVESDWLLLHKFWSSFWNIWSQISQWKKLIFRLSSTCSWHVYTIVKDTRSSCGSLPTWKAQIHDGGHRVNMFCLTWIMSNKTSHVSQTQALFQKLQTKVCLSLAHFVLAVLFILIFSFHVLTVYVYLSLSLMAVNYHCLKFVIKSWCIFH